MPIWSLLPGLEGSTHYITMTQQTGNASTKDGEKVNSQVSNPTFMPLNPLQMHEITSIKANNLQSLLTGYDEHKVEILLMVS